MEVTAEILEAKLAECKQAIEQTTKAIEHATGALNANYGAMQVLEEMLAVAKAEKPPASK